MPNFINTVDCNSKDYFKKDRDCAKCELKHPLPKKVLFECGNPGGSITFTSEGQSFTASSVSIDTTCLCRPKVKVEFSSIVSFSVIDGTSFPFEARLQFELIKVCGNIQEIVCDTRMYEKLFNENFGSLSTPFILTDSFTFVFCECNTCPGCCEYFVRVTAEVISINTTTMQNNVTATVSNGRMGIFASEC